MQDFIEKYKKKNLFTHISLLSLSFVLALSIHVFIKDTSFTQNLKWNVLESTTFSENTGDLSLQTVSNETQSVILNKKLQNISRLSFSLSFNPENLTILSVLSSESTPSNIEIISNTPWFVTVLASFATPISIETPTELFRVQTEKKDETMSFINIIQANVTNTSNEISNLSSSGIDF